MSFVYTKAKQQLAVGGLDFSTSDMRVALVMTNTTADTEEDVSTISAFTTLDEFDGSGYSSGGSALAAEAVAQDNVNNRAEFSATNLTFATLGAGTRSVQAALLYKFSGSFAASLPVAFIDTGGFPFTTNGGDINFTWNVEGIVQVT